MEENQAHAAGIEKLKIKHEKKEKATTQMRNDLNKYKSEQAHVLGQKAVDILAKQKLKLKSE
jgi:hypothetical protein